VGVLSGIPFALDVPGLMEHFHVAEGTDEAREFQALADRVRAVGRPMALFRECFVERRGEDTLVIEGVTFASRALRRTLDTVQRIFAFVATCGKSTDALEYPREEFVKNFWLDSMKGVLLGCAVRALNTHLDERFRLGKTASMSPGAGDATVWPIEQQKALFALLGDVEGAIGVHLTDSCLMVPNKSISGLRFATEKQFASCQVCHRERCPGRSAPFDRGLW
jgi:hypothetical protein